MVFPAPLEENFILILQLYHSLNVSYIERKSELQRGQQDTQSHTFRLLSILVIFLVLVFLDVQYCSIR